MNDHKFDVKKFEKLNNPKRLEMINLTEILKELNLPENPTLVDIGAGTGLFSEEFLNLLPTASLYALDISELMINYINEHRVPKFNSRLKALLMEESKTPIENNTADLVFTIMVHHELDDSNALLKDIKRILKSDGKLLICDWKEGMHHHFVKKEIILEDLKNNDFKNIKELNISENLVCFIASK
ncbi:MAG: class I SAM-dependent methyltransferase [Sarcina sp.]